MEIRYHYVSTYQGDRQANSGWNVSSTWWGKKGTDVNAAAEDGNTAVMFASHRGHREVV